MLLHIDYVTTYRYESPASGIIQKLKLTPQTTESQQILDWRVDVDVDGCLLPSSDPYGNICHVFYADAAVDKLSVHVSGRVITTDHTGAVRGTEEPLAAGLYMRSTPLTGITPIIASFADFHKKAGDIETLHALMSGLHAHMTFETGVTDSVTDADTAFQAARGVCQDYAQIYVAACRHLGYPARYVSGHYAGAGHEEQEAAHAWAEVLVPDLGWFAFDPTHAISPCEQHVRVAVGLDSLEAAPIRGSRRGGGAETLAVGVFGRQSTIRTQASQIQA